MKKTAVLLILFVMGLCEVFSQNVKIQVIDAETKEALPFVHVIFSHAKDQGTSTNIDGFFTIDLQKVTDSLIFSYVGYQTLKISKDSLQNIAKNTKIIPLKTSSETLQLITIGSAYNPAHRIISNAIANRKLNDPYQLNSFSYQCYNKLTLDFVPKETLPDSLKEKAEQVLKNSYMSLMESVSERTFLAPAHDNEVIIANKVAGFKNPTFATIATDFQPFGFYNEKINLLDKTYLNPIANNAIGKYAYDLLDSIFTENDTIFIISFYPEKGKNFDALEGILYIHSHKYAIQNIIAKNHESELIEIKIEQKYIRPDKQNWFCEQMHYHITYRNYPNERLQMHISGKSYIEQIKINPTLNKKDFRIDNVYLDENATKKDDLYWQKIRNEQLNEKEKNTYHVIDSIGEKQNFDKKLGIVSALIDNRLSLIGPIDLVLDKMGHFNRYEGIRLGGGIATNDKLSKHFSLQVYGVYGIKDKAFKYGTQLQIKPFKQREWNISGYYHNDIAELGQSNIYQRPFQFDRNHLLMTLVNNVENLGAYSDFRINKFLKAKLLYQQQNISAVNYTYTHLDTSLVNPTLQFEEIGAHIRIVFREKFVQTFGRRVSEGSNFPIIDLRATINQPLISQTEFSYYKLEFSFDWKKTTKLFGITNLHLDLLWLEGAHIPLVKSFGTTGSRTTQYRYVFPKTFQTVGRDEFFATKQSTLFASHDFGSFLFKTNKFKPTIALHYAAQYGITDSRNLSGSLSDINWQNSRHLLQEGGLVFGSLIRYKYLNILYLGIGAGVFHRFGAYALPTWQENTAWKISLTFSTN